VIPPPLRWIWKRGRSFWEAGDALVRAGQVAQGLRQLVLIAVALALPRLAVSTAEIGYWEQFQYLGYLLGFAWLTGIGQAYLARVRSLSGPAADRLTTSLLRVTLLLSVTLCGLLFFFDQFLLKALTNDPELPGWGLYLLFLLAHWPGLMYEQVLLAQHKANRLLWFSLLANLALLLALLLPLLLGFSWMYSLRWLAVASLVKVLLMIDGNSWRIWNPKATVSNQASLSPLADSQSPSYHVRLHQAGRAFETQKIQPASANDEGVGGLLKSAVPLVIYAALGGLIVSFDPWLVNYWFDGDDRQFAIYRYGTRELPLVMAITNGVGAALLPLLAKDRVLGLSQLKKSSLRLMHLFFPLTAILLLTSGWWWEIVFTSKFAESLPLFQIFLFVGISRMLMPIVVVTAVGRGKALIGLGLTELVLNGLFSVLFVGWYGLTGIVWATVLAYTLDKLLAAAYLYFREGIGIREYCSLPWLLAYSVALGLAYLWVSLP
jgi:O-antigen/teichoic acid export membrane protein